MISPAERLRAKPPSPLAQKEQPAPQPIWVETQAADVGRRRRAAPSSRLRALICSRDQVPRTPGIRTHSTARASASVTRNLVVPSGASVREATGGIRSDSSAAAARSFRPCQGNGSNAYAERSDRSTLTAGAIAPKWGRSSETGMSKREVTTSLPRGGAGTADVRRREWRGPGSQVRVEEVFDAAVFVRPSSRRR